MKVCDLVKMLNLTVFCGEEGLDTEITGGYTSDLLSDVMGHIEEGMLWITMQTHQNILAEPLRMMRPYKKVGKRLSLF